MRNVQKGFTLIELVVVIVILGILAATALPKFIDLTGEASTAAAEGVAGAISSASAINYAATLTGTAGTAAMTVANVCTNAILGATLTGGAMPTGFTVSGTGDCTTPVSGDSVSCTVTETDGGTATATVICTG